MSDVDRVGAVEARLVTPPRVAEAVLTEEYVRLLGYPMDREMTGRAKRLADASRDWYARSGRPWVFGRAIGLQIPDEAVVVLENGTRLESRALARRLRQGAAPALVAVAVSAGEEVDQRVDRLWREDRPDEAYSLDRFGAAVAEHLASWCGETLRSPGDEGLVALPGYSPGYDGWELEQQIRLFELIAQQTELPGPLHALDSGMLTPRNSLLSVFGLTARRELAREAWSRHRCAWCSLTQCGLRRESEPAVRDSGLDSG